MANGWKNEHVTVMVLHPRAALGQCLVLSVVQQGGLLATVLLCELCLATAATVLQVSDPGLALRIDDRDCEFAVINTATHGSCDINKN